jgi:hypothetical protein
MREIARAQQGFFPTQDRIVAAHRTAAVAA